MTGRATVPRSGLFTDLMEREDRLSAHGFLQLLPGDLQAMANDFIATAVHVINLGRRWLSGY